MNFITKLGLDKNRFTMLIIISLLVVGSLLYLDFPKREDPNITIRNASVTVKFPGMPPERMESLVAEKVERKIREIKEVKEIHTLLNTGRTKISVTLKDSVTDLDPVWQELREKMDDIKRELPTGAQGPIVDTNVGEVTIATIALTGEGFSIRELEVTAKELQRKMYNVDGVSKIDIYGIQQERLWLEFDAERLAAVGHHLQNMIADLQAQNIILPAGELNTGGARLLLETSGNFKSITDVELMLTKLGQTDEYARLFDLVEIRRGYMSPPERPVFFNGQPALSIGIQMQSGFDIQNIGREIDRVKRAFASSLPIGYELTYTTFQPSVVSASVNNALTNVGQTFLVVILVVLAFLGWRSSLVIGSIIPLAIMFSLIGMRLLGIALEQVSIAAVIISLGLLVDNGVVIVEDILRRINNGATRRAAALDAGQQFSTPLLVSSLTTIFAFTPFFMLEGAKGEYSFSLGAVVTLTLSGSWLASMYFLPLIASRTLERQTISPENKSGENHEENSPDNPAYIVFYQHFLHVTQKRPFTVIALSYALVALSVQLFPLIPQEQFPESERTEVLIYMDMPKSTHIDATIAVSKNVGAWINDTDKNPEVANQISYVGFGGPRFYLSLSPAERSPSNAFFLVNANSPNDANVFTARAKRYLIENHPEARFKIKRLAMGASESGTVEVEITGPDLDRLLVLARETESFFRGIPGLIQNENDWGDKILKFIVDVDQSKARRLGITSEYISQILSMSFDGYQVSDYREGNQSIPIMIRSLPKDRNSVEDVLNITLSGNPSAIAVEQISDLWPTLEYSQIRRKDQVRTITITAKTTQFSAGELYALVQKRIDSLDLSGGYQITIGGELEDAAETNGQLGAALPYALMLMFLAIMYQFNSFKRAVIVFMTVPLIFVGIPYGLLLTGEPMSFFATLGIISLAGIVINNAIVLIDQIDIEANEMHLQPAIIRAAERRLRPILLTSITTVLGLLPLYLFGGVLWVPLAIVMAFGLSVASILTLFFVPAAYLMFMRQNNESTLHKTK